MNPNKLSRLTITILMAVVGALFGWYAVGDVIKLVSTQGNFNPQNIGLALVYHVLLVVSGGIFGFAIGARLFQRIEDLGDRLRVMSASDKLALLIGPIIGLAVSALVALPIINNPLLSKVPAVGTAIAVLFWIVLTYFLTVATSSMKAEIASYLRHPATEEPIIPKEKFKILDTNVIIDGRIADIARAGFVEGPIYIPGFVLEELQHIADSHDSLKRARGRRGLDTLNQMDKELTLTVRTYDRLASATGEVDGRLVQLAKALDGALVTNDWNLNKVAELQGVPVLNINELANALKPVVLPGEEMHVLIVKEGKEPTQGIGYLDDGTMIVVEGGRAHMGENADVLVSSVLQTSAGKMIFAHMRDEEDYASDRGVRAYTGGRSRRPVRRAGE